MSKWIKTNTGKLINLADFAIFWLEENLHQEDGFCFAVFGDTKGDTYILSLFKSQGESMDFLDFIYMELLKHETKSP